MSKVLLIFYLIIATNFTDNLVSKQLKTYLTENRLAQHIIGFITLFVLLTSMGNIIDTKTAIIYSLIGYIWFILTTKLDIHWNMIVIAILVCGYLFENNLEKKEKDSLKDNNLTDRDRYNIDKKHSKIKSIIYYINKHIYIII